MQSVLSGRARPLVVVLLVALAVGGVALPALAWSPPAAGHANGHGRGHASAGPVTFSDVPTDHWAWKHIATMKAKGILSGYGGGLFGPQNHVTKLELVIMVTRLIGAEEEALALDEDDVIAALVGAFHDYRSIPTWPGAGECLAYALQQDYLWPLLQGRTRNFQPRTPATRLEVVVTLLEAMGLGDEARDMTDVPLAFRDAAAVPAWARGYVALAAKLGIVTGDGGNLRPNQPVTRCEMAALLDRADDDIDTDLDRDIVCGTVVSVHVAASAGGTSTITIIPGRFGQRYGSTTGSPAGAEVTFELAPAAVVIIDGAQARLADVHPGDHVALYLDEDGKVLLIDVEDEDDVTVKVTATLVAWTLQSDGDLAAITVRRTTSGSGSGTGTVTYQVADDVKITRDDEEVPVTEFEVGLGLSLTLTRGVVTAIDILTEPADQHVVTGTITRVTVGTGTGPTLISTISLIPDGGEAGDEETYRLASGAVIVINDALGDLGDVKAGDHATLTLDERDEVVLLEVEYETTEATGTLVRLVFDTAGKVSTITLEQDGRRTTYLVDPDVEITYDGDVVAGTELALGDELEVRIARGSVFSIEILEKAD